MGSRCDRFRLPKIIKKPEASVHVENANYSNYSNARWIDTLKAQLEFTRRAINHLCQGGPDNDAEVRYVGKEKKETK